MVLQLLAHELALIDRLRDREAGGTRLKALSSNVEEERSTTESYYLLKFGNGRVNSGTFSACNKIISLSLLVGIAGGSSVVRGISSLNALSSLWFG